jgi:hypothetical protein
VRDASFYVTGLLDLAKLTDAAERRATWRQSMAALAGASADDGPRPLDALQPEALVKGVRVALQMGMVDDLDWLARAAGGAALYELASALPVGAEQREVGRRVMARLMSGTAEEFIAIATRMAVGAARALSSSAVKSRIAIVAELPVGLGLGANRLAFALASRRELAREWIATPSTGSLAARRLAARLIERAAREAARRAAQGDDYALRIFRGDAVSEAWARLLSDRESLVWRHVAVARGLLAPYVPQLQTEIQALGDAALSPTEWRRAATSAAAQVAIVPEKAMGLIEQALAGDLLKRDRGAAAAFVWGVPRAAEAEPDAAAELLSWLLDRAPSEAAEAVAELRHEIGSPQFVERATALALEAFGSLSSSRRDVLAARDDGADALALEVSRDLERAPRDDEPLRDLVARALLLFVTGGAREAHAAAKEVLDSARGAVDALDAVTPEDEAAEGRAGSIARRTSFAVLRDIDMGLLERDALSNLLRLGAVAEGARPGDDPLDPLREGVAAWVMARESNGATDREAPLAHPTLSLRRLRTLLHLVDSDAGEGAGDPASAERLRARALRMAHALLERFEGDPAPAVKRTIAAALARVLDALVRADACDVGDVLLAVVRRVESPKEFETLAEASMDPDLRHVLLRYAAFVRACSVTKLAVIIEPGSSLVPLSVDPAKQLQGHLDALLELSREIAPEGGGRAEALRAVLGKLHAALEALASAHSLGALSGSGSKTEVEAVAALESALGALVQLSARAVARLDPERAATTTAPIGSSRALSVAVSRVLSGAEPKLADGVVAACISDLLASTPQAISSLVSRIVWRLVDLPTLSRDSDSAQLRIVDALPPWLPPRRTIGGFYVLRPLSAGAVGSVFVVTRSEDRNDPTAERFALKVPEFSATAARSVSEADFLKMFRDEASALLTLPAHKNLARFVTFDAGARPKPILVMELVEGMTLDRLIESGALDMARAFRALDDVLAGLEAMHALGIGHLDLKPGNVVVRKQADAVLVDFGLAGRHIRPGCATGSYGAPEIWLGEPENASPIPADIYAFGCVAFEVLTGRTLFSATDETAQISMHIAHDGYPPPMKKLAERSATTAVAEVLYSTLRRHPAHRPSARAVREQLAKLAPQLGHRAWPLS